MLIFGKEKDNTPSFGVKTIVQRFLVRKVGVSHQRDVFAEQTTNIIIAQRVISDFFCVAHYK